MARCWLIGDWTGRLPLMAGQYARLRNIEAEFCTVSDGHLPPIKAAEDSLIAMGFDRLRQLVASARARLNELVSAGATLYLCGGLTPGARVSLAPFTSGEFSAVAGYRACSYRVEPHPMIPATLAGEEVAGRYMLAGAEGLAPGQVEPALVGRSEDGQERPLIFTIAVGRGSVIYDLNPDETAPDTPIIDRLANPIARASNIGPLMAANQAASVPRGYRPAFNLTLDDRPVNLDYFNVAKVVRLLDRILEHLPNAHVDFAWTPNQSHPSHRYVEALKRYNTGFIWHGFCRRIDHRKLLNPRAELAEGIRLVEGISRKYKVRFQPVMLFPFSRDNELCTSALHESGFRAKVEWMEPADNHAGTQRDYLKASQVDCLERFRGFAVLHCRFLQQIDYDWMLARTALGLPLLATANPDDLALTTFARAPWNNDSLDDLDRILEFAASKRLRSCSLEEIAIEACSSTETAAPW
jgi:hypothetical protein